MVIPSTRSHFGSKVLAKVMARPVWVATLGASQRWRTSEGSYSTDFNGAAQQHLQVDIAPEANQILGIAMLQPGSKFNSLSLLSGGERVQYGFWQSVCGPDLEGQLCSLAVSHALRLPAPQPIMQTHRRKLRTFFVYLEIGLPEQLWGQLGGAFGAVAAEAPNLCVRLPAPFADRIVSGEWSGLLLPNPDTDMALGRGGRLKSNMLGITYWPALRELFLNVPRAPVEDESLTEVVALQMADEFRRAALGLDLDDELDREQLVQLHRYAHLLQRMCDEMSPTNIKGCMLECRGRTQSQNLRYQSMFLVKCLLLSHLLRDSANLAAVVKRSLQLCLPGVWSRSLVEQLCDKPAQGGVYPSASKISRARLLLDVAFMRLMRDQNHTSLQGSGAVRYLLADSSVQGHRDFELVRMHSISRDSLQLVVSAAHTLFHLWSVHDAFAAVEDADSLQQDAELLDILRAHVKTHSLPSVVVGSARSSFPHKFHSIVHALMLESLSLEDLGSISREISAITTDQGVEFGFHRVQQVPMEALFPWRQVPGARQDDDDDFAFAPALDQPQLVVDFSGTVSVAGLLHIIHNTSNDLGNSLNCYDRVVLQMAHVSNMIRREDTRIRLFEACFADDLGRHLQSDFKQFDAKVHKPRWGSIANSVLQLRRVEKSLRFRWDAGRYGSASRPGDEGEGDDCSLSGTDVTIINEAIRFTVASILPDKSSEAIIRAFSQDWHRYL